MGTAFFYFWSVVGQPFLSLGYSLGRNGSFVGKKCKKVWRVGL